MERPPALKPGIRTPSEICISPAKERNSGPSICSVRVSVSMTIHDMRKHVLLGEIARHR